MAEVTITGLPNASALTGAERVPMDQSGTTVDATTAAIAALAPQGTVTSVGLVAPTGFSVSGSPVTAAGNITLTYAAGYSVPTTASQTTWDTAYTERRQWDGGSTNLDAATGRASLGAAASGAVGSSGLTMATARLLGRTTAGTGAVEEITVSGATLSGGVLTITGATDLSYTASTRLLESSTGTDVTLPLATTGLAGLMSASDKTKLDGVASGATAFDPASPGAIGGTTAGAGSFTALSASTSLRLPSGAPGTPAERHIYAVADTLRYRDSGNVERLILNATDNLANLASAATARGNLGLGSAATAASTDFLASTFTASTISYAATVDLDMAALAGLYRTISLTGNLTFTTSNRAAGRTVTIRLICDSTQRTLTFPAGWVFVGAKPANIAASKTAVLSLAFFGTADTDCVAAYAVQS